MHDIAPAEIEGIDVTIKLANRDKLSLEHCVGFPRRGEDDAAK